MTKRLANIFHTNSLNIFNITDVFQTLLIIFLALRISGILKVPCIKFKGCQIRIIASSDYRKEASDILQHLGWQR